MAPKSTAKKKNVEEIAMDGLTGSRIFTLHREIHSHRQGSSSVSQYYKKLQELWEEQSTIFPTPSCKCATSRDYAKMIHTQRLLEFLTGLNDFFDGARTQILLMQPLPTVDQAFAMIIEDEAHQSIANHSKYSPVDGAAMAARRRRRGKCRERECAHCHKKGHTKDACWDIIGYPADRKARQSQEDNAQQLGEEFKNDAHNLYDVTFHHQNIHTLLTSSPSLVDSWLSETLNLYSLPQPLIVGLDVEWRPNTHRNMENPVAILQLCVGPRCLIFQILHSPYVPQSLISFLGSANHTFVGVGIEEDVEKLVGDYGLSVATFVDLRDLAVDKLGDKKLKRSGLKALAWRVLAKEMEKPKSISRSRWDDPWLTAEQVKYACIDAFVSFEVGRLLDSVQR